MAGRRSAGWARGLVTRQRRGTQVGNWGAGGAAAAVLWRWRLGAWRQSLVLWRSIWVEVDKGTRQKRKKKCRKFPPWVGPPPPMGKRVENFRFLKKKKNMV